MTAAVNREYSSYDELIDNKIKTRGDSKNGKI